MSTLVAHIIPLALTLFLIGVGTVDWKIHRIPNYLTVTAAASGVALNGLAVGPAGLLLSIEGLAVGLGMFLPLFVGRGFGAGDVKAMAAVGAFVGPRSAFFAVLWTLVAGLVAGLFVLARTGGLSRARELLHRWLFQVYALYAGGSFMPAPLAPQDPAARRFPYGIAIAIGTLVSVAPRVYRG